jgi:cell division protein FtsI (penicillin-binding protein 3)
LRSFGLGSRTAVDFPGQAAGLLLDPAHYYATGLASTAIGYGVAVTGMQILDAYVTIADGGVTRPPRLLEATVDSHGVRHAAQLQQGRRVVSARTAEEMSAMLAGVVSTGTGACAAIPGYTIAGKTGTAHKAVNGRYTNGTMASFIGYAPAAHPKLAAIVVLDEPANTYGGTAAAPVFADVMQFALSHYGVAPDDIANTQYNSARASAAQTGSNCVDPAAAAAAAALAPVHPPAPKHTAPPTSTPATSTPATKSASKSTLAGKGGAPATPGSLPRNTSQSG